MCSRRTSGAWPSSRRARKNFNVVAANVFWANATDAENLEKPADSITADPQFADPNHGDFTVRGPGASKATA